MSPLSHAVSPLSHLSSHQVTLSVSLPTVPVSSELHAGFSLLEFPSSPSLSQRDKSFQAHPKRGKVSWKSGWMKRKLCKADELGFTCGQNPGSFPQGIQDFAKDTQILLHTITTSSLERLKPRRIWDGEDGKSFVVFWEDMSSSWEPSAWSHCWVLLLWRAGKWDWSHCRGALIPNHP